MTEWRIIEGDCVDQMRRIRDDAVDAIVTDPPYELGIAGKSWDRTGVAFSPTTWREALRILKPGGNLIAFGGSRTYHRTAVAIEDAGFELRDSLMWLYGKGVPKGSSALKPAFEPIVLATKGDGPLALNVEACRIEFQSEADRASARPQGRTTSGRIVGGGGERKEFVPRDNSAGRRPANVMIDDEVAWMIGDPARFFYCTKASKADRGGEFNMHPTVKPIALMRWLVRLATPPGGIVIDPFAGSGTTILAARMEGLRAVSVERDAAYVEIARRRIEAEEILRSKA